MHVNEILARKGSDVATIGPDETIGAAADILAERGFGALVVSTGDGSINGIISERDLVRGLAQFGERLRDQKVSSLMTTPVKTCVGSDKTGELMERMTSHRIRHLPVEQDGKLVGMISIGDVVKVRVSELEEEARHLEGYISGAGYA